MARPVQPDAAHTEPDWRVWARIGVQSFGGPAAQVALMHRVLVEERRWLDEAQFLRALGFCMLLPGPEAMQLATYAGWRRGGVPGGLTAGLWFVLPGAVLVTALAALAVGLGHLPAVQAAFRGIQAAVLVLVADAVRRLAPRALRDRRGIALALGAFVALTLFTAPFPAVVLAAGVLGLSAPVPPPTPAAPPPAGSWSASARTALLWGAVWAAPLVAVAMTLGGGHILTQLGAFFSQLAVVTFGGAYAALAWMAQDIVGRHGWLTAERMLQGLGLAETTPGPLLLVTSFVGFVAAANAHPAQPFSLGLAGSAVALWATFAPCFLWIFAGAPHVERLAHAPRLQGALAAITAAVVGVIAQLALWFALHVLFRATTTTHAGPVRLTVPEWASFDPGMLGLAAACAGMLLGLRWSVHRTLAVSVALAWLLSRLG
jgi:chromate transporter